jgi:hypothetical protein
MGAGAAASEGAGDAAARAAGETADAGNGEAVGAAVGETCGVVAGAEAGEADSHAGRDVESTTFVAETWQVAGHSAFLFHIESLSAGIRTLLKLHAPSFRIHAGDPVDGEHWANHCDRCGFPQDDEALFCEPEGAFFPTDEASARRIELLCLEAAFAAAAGGYAPEPQFFDAMSRE